MNPLKILTAFVLLLVISACNSDALELSKFNSTDLLKSDSSNLEMDDGCETAFAKFDPFCKWNGFVFSITKKTILEEGFGSLGWTNNKWGWATNIPDNHNRTHSFNLWAGAAHHDTAKGTLVGEVEYSRTNNSDLKVTYTILPGYHLEEVHIYANDIKPYNLVPGQYGFTKEFSSGVTSFSTDFNNVIDTDGDGVWVIAHAVVCEDM